MTHGTNSYQFSAQDLHKKSALFALEKRSAVASG